MNKCIKGESCLHCDTDYCRFKDEVAELKAENEKLKEELNNYKTSKENSYKNLQKEWQQCQWDVRKLTTENERLKNSLKICQGLCKTLEKAKANEHNHWFNRCCEINTECDKYRQALQEIRDIVDKNISFMDTSSTTKAMIRIQAKINEVIGAE